MGMLFFLPWISFEKEYDFSQFKTLPYNSRCENGSEIKKYSTDIKRILSYYKTVVGTSIQFTSILIHAEKTLLSNLSEDEISDMFVYGEMLKLAGLSKREYFSSTKEYSNSDTYRLVLQKFQSSDEIPVIESRRRDGLMSAGFVPEMFQVVCPFHVSPFVSKTLDVPLVECNAEVLLK